MYLSLRASYFFKALALCLLLLLGARKEGYGQGPIRTYLEGQKTGNFIQNSLITLGPGTADITSPIKKHSYLGVFRYFYGEEDVLSENSTDFSSLIAAQDIGLLHVLGAGSDVYLQIRNTNNEVLPANTTTYVTLNERPINSGISIDVGGLLGLVELTNVKGYGYKGASNYKLNSGILYNGDEKNGSIVGASISKFLVDSNGKWYLAVTPNEDYNSVRVEVKLPNSLRVADLASNIKANIYNAFTETQGNNCSTAGRYTSPGEATGINLNTGIVGGLELNQLISNPHYVLNNNADQFASYSSGVASVGVANTVSQTIYFDHIASANDGVSVKLGLKSDLINLDLLALNGISFSAYKGVSETVVWKGELGSLVQLLGLNLLDLITIGDADHKELDLTFKPGVEFDRIKIEFNKGLLGVGVIGDALRVYNISLAPSAPEIEPSTGQPQDIVRCEGETATFSVNASVPAGGSISYQWQWFDGNNWVNITQDGNSSTYLIDDVPFSYNDRKYRVVIIGGASGCPQIIYSNEALLTVIPEPGKPHLTITDIIN